MRSSTARRGAESVQRAADPTRRRDKTVEATGNREGGRRRPRSVPLTQAVFGPASSGFTVALTTATGEGWGAVRREVRGETGGSARREAIARLGEYREIGTTTRGDAATRGERRCRAPWTVIVPEGMTPSGVPRSSEGEMRDEPGARVRLRRPRGPRAAVVVGLALGACMSFSSVERTVVDELISSYVYGTASIRLTRHPSIRLDATCRDLMRTPRRAPHAGRTPPPSRSTPTQRSPPRATLPDTFATTAFPTRTPCPASTTDTAGASTGRR